MNWLILFLDPENVGLDTKIIILDEILSSTTKIMWLWDFQVAIFLRSPPENLLLKMAALKNGNKIFTVLDINKNAFIIVGNN